MKRNDLLALPPSDATSAAADAANVSTHDGSANLCPHSIFVPLHYEPGYQYPLFVWLHGPGDDEQQLKRIMPLLNMRNYAAVAPRGTVHLDDGDGATSRFRWKQDADHVFLAEQRVLECIDHAKCRLSVASRRVFIGGYQCGGTMALRLAMNHPQRFAGAVSIGGRFPTGLAPLRFVSEARQTPLLIAGGRASRAYSQSQLCRDLRLLHCAGMSVTLRLYPCGDELITNMLDDANRWMMEQMGVG